MKKSLLLIALVLIVSCNDKDSKKSDEINISEEIKTESKTKNDFESSEIFKKLQGTWVNNLDAFSTLTFDGRIVINAYQDTLSVRTMEFVLGNSCLNSPAVAEDDKKDLFITTTGKTSECYFIKELNDSILTMEFMTGKIDLTFTRKK